MSSHDLHPTFDDENSDSDVKSLLEEGLFRFGAGDNEGAIDVWKRVLALDPGNNAAVDYLKSAGVTPMAAIGPGRPPGRAQPAAPPAPEITIESTDEQARYSVYRSQSMPVINPADLAVAKRQRLIYVAFALAALLGVVALVALLRGGGASDGGAAASVNAVNAEAPVATNPAAVGGAAAAAASHFDVSIIATPSTADIYLDDEHIATGKATLRLPRNGTKRTVRLEADGYETYEGVFLDVAPPERIVLDRAAGVPSADRPKSKKRPPRRRARRNRSDRSKGSATTSLPVAPAPASTDKTDKTDKADKADKTDKEAPKSAPVSKPKSKRTSPTDLPPTNRPSDNKDPWAK